MTHSLAVFRTGVGGCNTYRRTRQPYVLIASLLIMHQPCSLMPGWQTSNGRSELQALTEFARGPSTSAAAAAVSTSPSSPAGLEHHHEHQQELQQRRQQGESGTGWNSAPDTDPDLFSRVRHTWLVVPPGALWSGPQSALTVQSPCSWSKSGIDVKSASMCLCPL